MFSSETLTKIQPLDSKKFELGSYSVSMLREDEIHPFVSGNKFRKLKYNFLEASRLEMSTILTFGGAYSNHIAAVAAAGKQQGFKTIGVIRGEELASQITTNPTLAFAVSCGMKLHFVSRSIYRSKMEASFQKRLKELFGSFYLIPEGGTNQLAVRGCEEMLSVHTASFDYISTCVGTGGTISGIIKASEMHQTVLGFSALKGAFQISEIEKYTPKTNFQLTDAYCFGGYAKIDEDLVRFINEFHARSGIPLDPVYTGKMMFGLFDMMKSKKLKENSRILAIHTGGLQGIDGMNQKLKNKNLPQINK